MHYLKLFKILITIAIIFNFTACEKKVSTEVKEIHWDRDV